MPMPFCRHLHQQHADKTTSGINTASCEQGTAAVYKQLQYFHGTVTRTLSGSKAETRRPDETTTT